MGELSGTGKCFGANFVVQSSTGEYFAQNYFAPRNVHRVNHSQYYFVLQFCTKYFPALLCTAKFAQGTCRLYFSELLAQELPVLIHTTKRRVWSVECEVWSGECGV